MEEVFLVVSNHTVHPKGEHKAVFPTRAAAENFLIGNTRQPGISSARLLDPKGRLVIDYVSKEKDAYEWVPNAAKGYRRILVKSGN